MTDLSMVDLKAIIERYAPVRFVKVDRSHGKREAKGREEKNAIQSLLNPFFAKCHDCH